MNPLISVIVPAFNAEKHIEACLKSILGQTYSNLEIWVVDDGSTDSTPEIVERISKTDNRINLFSQPNSGVSSARNKGIEISKGELIGFVDADDRAHPGLYLKLFEKMNETGSDISHSGFEMKTGSVTKKFYGTEKVYIQNSKEALISLLNDHLFEPGVWNKLYKREIIKNIRFDTGIKFNEDLIFNVEAFLNSKTIVYFDKILYTYIRNDESATLTKKKEEAAQHVVLAAKKVREKIGDKIPFQNSNRFFNGKLIMSYQSLISEPDSEIKTEIRNLLKPAPNTGLSARGVLIKTLILYFPGFYRWIKSVYDRTAGKNKTWNLNK